MTSFDQKPTFRPVKDTLKLLVDLLPRTRFFDRIHHYILFYVAHRRVPRRESGLFSDYLFFLKNSHEIEDVARQFTSDKIYVKEWIERRLGPGYTPKTLQVINDPAEVANGPLPDHCVIKPSHLSGYIYFCEDGSAPLPPEVVHGLRKTFYLSLYRLFRERNYRHLRGRLLCEEMIQNMTSVRDYKVFCYRGTPRLIQVDVGRHSSHTRRLYTTDWQPLDIWYDVLPAQIEPPPSELARMLDLAKKLAGDFESVRVDFYITPAGLFIGELTHCPCNANGRFATIEQERLFSHLYFGLSEQGTETLRK